MGQFTSTSFEPVIKWSGSKRSQCGEIVSKFPDTISTYYEPFIGGGSVLRCLMESGEHRVGKFIASDLNDGLINLWKSIRDCPRKVVSHYSDLWHQMNDGNHDKAFKRSFFNSIRERYNKEHSPLDFMFIMRTTTNGMPRYNSAGDFNNSFHITRDGIHPDSLGRIVTEWSRLLNRNQVEFICRTFADVCPQNGDFVYLDPPYANTKGMYFGGFDNMELFRWLDDANKKRCKWAMSYAGMAGDEDLTYKVPACLYKKHMYIISGNSSFRRVIGKSRDTMVYESLYLNYEPEEHGLF